MDGKPTIASSARRHQVSDVDIHHAFDHPMWIEDLDDGFLMAVSPGTTGRLREIGIVEGADGPVVVHAMPARAKYVR